MPRRVALELQGDLDALHLVWLVLEELLGQVGPAEDQPEQKYATLVAVQEALTNILRHAYGGDSSFPLRIEVEAGEDRLSITAIDYGPPFTPEFHGHSTWDGPPREGGYGLPFIHTVMSNVFYRREGDANVLCMVKEFPARVPVEAAGGTP